MTPFTPLYVSINELDEQRLSELVMPVLQDMVDNQHLLDRHLDRRFNRDAPPQYRSPSEDEDDDDGDDSNPHHGYEDLGFDLLHPLQSITDQDRVKIDNLISEPLTDAELHKSLYYFESFQTAYHPGKLYMKAVAAAKWRVLMPGHGCPDNIRKGFNGRAGSERLMVLLRHGIKKRWQRLGVWNPDWGIPGRANPQARDNYYVWKWRWQGESKEISCAIPDPNTYHEFYNAKHPNSRAVYLRQRLRRGEASAVPPPHHKLEPDASQSTADAFITSRPWYVFQQEVEEERTRLGRLSGRARRLYNESPGSYVRARWDKGDKYNTRDEAGCFVIGWKWGHESPSPEPQDLTEQELVCNPDWTPSEIDALEAIAPPSPPPYFPTPPPRSPRWDSIFGPVVPSPGRSIFDASAADPETPGSELDGNDDVEEAAPSPPRARTRGQTRRAAAVPAAAAPDPCGPPRLRQSERIAAQRRQPEHVVAAPEGPSGAASRGKRAPNKASGSRAKSTAGPGTVAQPGRGRGRPRKGAAPPPTSKPQGVAKRGRGRPRKSAAPPPTSKPRGVAKRERGRPRKT